MDKQTSFRGFWGFWRQFLLAKSIVAVQSKIIDKFADKILQSQGKSATMWNLFKQRPYRPEA
jgi:hypothetical protein